MQRTILIVIEKYNDYINDWELAVQVSVMTEKAIEEHMVWQNPLLNAERRIITDSDLPEIDDIGPDTQPVLEQFGWWARTVLTQEQYRSGLEALLETYEPENGVKRGSWEYADVHAGMAVMDAYSQLGIHTRALVLLNY